MESIEHSGPDKRGGTDGGEKPRGIRLFCVEYFYEKFKMNFVNLAYVIAAQMPNTNPEIPGIRTDDLPALLLLLLVLKMLVLGGLCVAMIRFIVRQRHLSVATRHAPHTDSGSSRLMFEPPACWLAVQCKDMRLVEKSLRLKNTKPCAWDDGLHAGKDHQLFLSPPIGGWILVFGPGLTHFANDPDACFRFIRMLSGQTGVVQFFSANRIVNHHGWVLANEGEILRGYSWAGETVWNQGPMTAAERALGIVCFDYGEKVPLDETLEADPALSNTEKVPQLAGRWSINPTSINLKPWMRQTGLVGEF